MATTIIYPLVSSEFRLVPGPISYFSETDYVRKIVDADFDLMLNHLPPEYIGLLDSKFKCVYALTESPNIREDEIFLRAGMIALTLNYFAARDAIELPVAIVMRDLKNERRIDFYSQPGSSVASRNATYRLWKRTTIADLRRFFSLVREAGTKSSRVRVMIDRFNSALRRERIEDKIIDLSIALETMLEESTEISFRLSLFLANIAAEKRSDIPTIYKAFRSLYDARSKIVHGGVHSTKSKALVSSVASDFDRILKYSKLCMLYYYSFIETNPPKAWSEHCLELALGSAARAL